jgi:hypothetical protein
VNALRVATVLLLYSPITSGQISQSHVRSTGRCISAEADAAATLQGRIVLRRRREAVIVNGTRNIVLTTNLWLNVDRPLCSLSSAGRSSVQSLSILLISENGVNLHSFARRHVVVSGTWQFPETVGQSREFSVAIQVTSIAKLPDPGNRL